MPMRIVAVQRDGSLAGDLSDAQAGAGTGGYSVIEFDGPADLIPAIQAQLAANNYDCLEYLEIVAHGEPTSLDNILEATAAAFGAQLKTLNLCDICEVYMSGCNTAINLKFKDSFAQVVSAAGPTVVNDNVMLTVYGSVGYIAGMHATGNEDTAGNRGGMGSQANIYLPGYPDAPDARGGPGVNIGSYTAVGNACWRGYREGRRVI
jgi:hypothetical protein